MEYGVREKVNHNIQSLGKTKTHTRPRDWNQNGQEHEREEQAQFKDEIEPNKSFD